MRALFMRGAFTAADAAAAGATLQAYAIGLLPFVLMRSATVTFLSRGDTWTPVKALFFAVLVNVALKVCAAWHLCAGRARLRDLDRRLGEPRAADLVRAARRPVRFRCRRSCARRSAWRRPGWCMAVVLWLADAPVRSLVAGTGAPQRARARLARRHRRRGLWRDRDRAVRPPLVCGVQGTAASTGVAAAGGQQRLRHATAASAPQRYFFGLSSITKPSSALGSAGSSLSPAGMSLTASMSAITSIDCWAVSVPGASVGIISRT